MAYYTSLALAAEPPVLELGCGTGRVTIAIARAGVEVTGLDLSAPMLTEARRKGNGIPRLTWVHADMRSLALTQRFGLICIPFRSLQHLLTDDDLHAALRRCWEHLRPNGVLAFNLMNPRMGLPSPKHEEQPGPRISRLHRGRPLRLLCPEEVSALLTDVGFCGIEAFGGFDGESLRTASTEQVWLARRYASARR